ncbi:MAG TPA: hypothetical protein VHD91_08850, partial [Gaiellaceae bacterium]|nr:hypothetical protein [Gaiellaceae bacterium]
YRFDCLLYSPPGHPRLISAYEICFDPDGRLVQTIDRHTGTPHFASLLEQPSSATFRVPVPRLIALFRRLGVFGDDRLAGKQDETTTLPTIDADSGARYFPRPPKS